MMLFSIYFWREKPSFFTDIFIVDDLHVCFVKTFCVCVNLYLVNKFPKHSCIHTLFWWLRIILKRSCPLGNQAMSLIFRQLTLIFTVFNYLMAFLWNTHRIRNSKRYWLTFFYLFWREFLKLFFFPKSETTFKIRNNFYMTSLFN